MNSFGLVNGIEKDLPDGFTTVSTSIQFLMSSDDCNLIEFVFEVAIVPEIVVFEILLMLKLILLLFP
jgi:hypothetical protein